MIIKALIPVRSGSERVKNKNLKPFADSSLLEIKIKQLQRITELDGIIVNSNCDEMLDIAKALGCETVKRNEYYASSIISINEVYKNIGESANSDIIVYTNCTNPLLNDSSISQAINLFLDKPRKNDTVNSAHLIKEFLWKDGIPLNYSLNEMPKSQNLPDIYALNFAINIFTKDYVIKNSSIVGKSPLLYELNELEATDIDNEIDFEFAEFMYKKIHNLCLAKSNIRNSNLTTTILGGGKRSPRWTFRRAA